MNKANNTLKRAKKIKFNQSSKTFKNRLKKHEGSDLFRLEVTDRLVLDFTLSKLKKDLDFEIYFPKKKLRKVLRKIGKKKFGTLSEKRIDNFLDRIGKSDNSGRKDDRISGLVLEPGTYFIRVYGKKRKHLSKYNLTLEPTQLRPQITSYPASASVTENETWVTDIEAQDFNGDREDNGGLTYSITAESADGAFFSIEENSGELQFTAPDFENPQDQNGDNFYEVEVEVKDSTGRTDSAAITIEVIDDPEIPPDEPESPDIVGGDTVTVRVIENTLRVTDVNVMATDPEGDTENNGGLTYEISGGADQNLFTINRASGVLNFREAPDFENPNDRGRNNSYEVAVTVTDSQNLTDTQTITVEVEDLDFTSLPNNQGRFDWDDPLLWSDAFSNLESFAPAWIYGQTESLETLREWISGGGYRPGEGVRYPEFSFDTSLPSEQSFKYLPFYINGSYEESNGEPNDNSAIFQLTIDELSSPVAFSQETYVIQRNWFDEDIAVSELSDVGEWFIVDESTYPNATPKLEYNGQFHTTTVVIVDSLHATSGDDILLGNPGSDKIFAGDGDDTIQGGSAFDGDFTNEILDHFHGGRGDDVISAEGGDPAILYGGAGDDKLTASDRDDDYIYPGTSQLHGGTGSDRLYGRQNDDILDGGIGNDSLVGGRGDDTLIGGSGEDVFYFNSPQDGVDTIQDFSVTDDKVWINRSGFELFGGPDSLALVLFSFDSSTNTLSFLSTEGTTREIIEFASDVPFDITRHIQIVDIPV